MAGSTYRTVRLWSCHPPGSVCLQLQCTRRAGLLAYEHGKSAQYITPTHAHTRTAHPLAHTFVCDDRFITAIQLIVRLVLVYVLSCLNFVHLLRDLK